MNLDLASADESSRTPVPVVPEPSREPSVPSHSSVRSRFPGPAWTPEEDAKLALLLGRLDTEWKDMRAAFPTRCGDDIRFRWGSGAIFADWKGYGDAKEAAISRTWPWEFIPQGDSSDEPEAETLCVPEMAATELTSKECMKAHL
jgi:hypothetical protein